MRIARAGICVLAALVSGAPPALAAFTPFFDDVPGSQLDSSKWISTAQAASSSDGNGEPSQPNSLRLRKNGHAESQVMDASAATGLVLTYHWQRTGSDLGKSPEPGEDLIVEYVNDQGAWALAATHPGDGSDTAPYMQESFLLPGDALHSGFQIRFRMTGDKVDDHFYIDDVAVDEEAPVAPFPGCVRREHVFTFEDTGAIMNDPTKTSSDRRVVIVDAINEFLASHGDVVDFFGVWTTTANPPGISSTQTTIQRDIAGLNHAGSPNAIDYRALFGVNLEVTKLKGYVDIHDVERFDTSPDGPGRLVFHELGHYWGAFLPPISGGRRLEANDGVCGARGNHWRWQFGQGPSALGFGSNVEYNDTTGCYEVTTTGNDFGGDLYSSVELYLLGYVPESEVDSLRDPTNRVYFDQGCTFPYCGPVSPWSIQDIVDVAGPRIPDASVSQKDFRIAWIAIYQTGAPPTPLQMQKYVDRAHELADRWEASTLSRGTLYGQIFPDGDCDGVPDFPDCNGNLLDDATDLSGMTSPDCNGNARPDECDLVAATSGDGNDDDVPDECDADLDTFTGLAGDCDDRDGTAWAEPTAARDLLLTPDTPTGGTKLDWTAPADPGGSVVTYDSIRSLDPADFTSGATCIESGGSDLTAVDTGTIGAGEAAFYLIRADNGCPGGGTLGETSSGVPRTGRTCP